MKLSPLDIEHMEFTTSVGGFGKRQVREFLERVSEQLEETLRDNQSLRDELKKRDGRIEELQVGEVELKRAVIAAERIANEIKENAKHEASLILREADGQRTNMLREAETRLRSTRAELSRLEREQQLFREQFRGLLRAYDRTLDQPEARRSTNPDGAGAARPQTPAATTESK
ncbi:MAG: DivIVA domain-containing protein [Trueperaceae bacterium]